MCCLSHDALLLTLPSFVDLSIGQGRDLHGVQHHLHRALRIPQALISNPLSRAPSLSISAPPTLTLTGSPPYGGADVRLPCISFYSPGGADVVRDRNMQNDTKRGEKGSQRGADVVHGRCFSFSPFILTTSHQLMITTYLDFVLPLNSLTVQPLLPYNKHIVIISAVATCTIQYRLSNIIYDNQSFTNNSIQRDLVIPTQVTMYFDESQENILCLSFNLFNYDIFDF